MLLWETGGKVKRVSKGDARKMIGKALWSEEAAASALGELRRGEIEFIDAKGWGRFKLDGKEYEKAKRRLEASKNRAAKRRASEDV